MTRHGGDAPAQGLARKSSLLPIVEEFSADSETFWAVVKLFYNGHVQYIPSNGS